LGCNGIGIWIYTGFREILIFFRVGVGIGEVYFCGRLGGAPLGLTKWGKVIILNGVGFD